jgi:hypothetical protein
MKHNMFAQKNETFCKELLKNIAILTKIYVCHKKVDVKYASSLSYFCCYSANLDICMRFLSEKRNYR